MKNNSEVNEIENSLTTPEELTERSEWEIYVLSDDKFEIKHNEIKSSIGYALRSIDEFFEESFHDAERIALAESKINQDDLTDEMIEKIDLALDDSAYEITNLIDNDAYWAVANNLKAALLNSGV